MTSLLPISQKTEVVYPSSDGEPLAETSAHVDAIINTVVALRHYLSDCEAIVLADQFLYYAQGFPKLRVAPDVMVIFNVPPGPRDNFKTWEEGQIPSVIFEMTSACTCNQDEIDKKNLYEKLEVQEYWQFDPKGEWIAEKLRGYRLQADRYVPITDDRCTPLQLRLAVDGEFIAFYQEETGEKLLAPNELVEALRQEVLARQQAEVLLQQETFARQQAEVLLQQERQRAEQAELEVQQLRERLRQLGVEPDS